MMRHIAIVGAGQAGLLLAIGLLRRGVRVTLISDRTPEQILHGPIPAAAFIFDNALQVERDLEINYWDGTALGCNAIHIDALGPEGGIGLSIEAPLHKPGICIDQRLKAFRWMQEFERRGGHLVVKPATVEGLEGYVREHDLVIVAAGRGEISQLFARNEERSPFSGPARNVSMVAVTGTKDWHNFKTPGVKFTILPGVGEIFSAPLYAKDQVQARFLGFEAIAGGPMDRFRRGMDPLEQLETSKAVFRELLPWDYESVRDAVLVDDRAYLFAAITPVVRDPVGRLPSGAHVMGIADAVILNDPIAAQGANNAAKMARLVADQIAAHGDRPFDPAWMTAVFEEFWTYGRYVNLLNQLLLLPPQPYFIDLLGAASQIPAVASDFINGFNHPPSVFPWIADPDEAGRYLQSKTTA
jgi:2-polyprenyl-6-methoxyphenol hydroxylase-like FAD-dependent oxidoreductase